MPELVVEWANADNHVMIAKKVAEEMVEGFCGNPQIWATHGCPGETKLNLIKSEIFLALVNAFRSGFVRHHQQFCAGHHNISAS